MESTIFWWPAESLQPLCLPVLTFWATSSQYAFRWMNAEKNQNAMSENKTSFRFRISPKIANGFHSYLHNLIT